MNREIQYRDVTNDGAEVCRALCNRLMRFQAAKAERGTYQKILGTMCFENRLLPDFLAAREKQLLAAFDGERPIGYVFSAAVLVTEENRDARPAWAAEIPGETKWLYPDWLNTPAEIGELDNLYVLPEYRGLKVGQRLMERAMDWLCADAKRQWLFVNVANGNDVAPFYERYGFTFSHEVLGGLIRAYCRPAAAR